MRDIKAISTRHNDCCIITSWFYADVMASKADVRVYMVDTGAYATLSYSMIKDLYAKAKMQSTPVGVMYKVIPLL